MNIKKPLIIHPFLFAVFPVLFLFVHNIGELEFSVVIIPLTFVLLFTLLLLFLSRLILRNNQKAAVLLSFALILLFSYGPFSQLTKNFRLPIDKFVIGPNKLFFITSGILFCFGAYFIIKTHKNLRDLTKILNVVASSLVLISLLSISVYEFTGRRSSRNDRGKITEKTNRIIPGKADKLPNIYYIILDEYGRADILNELYGYDNAEFINYLKQKGFYVAGKSKSNYHTTLPSLESSLNLSYLNSADCPNPMRKIRNNRVFSLMKQYGYRTVFVSSFNTEIKIDNADFYMKYDKLWLDDFQYELINLTPILDLVHPLNLLSDMYSLHRERFNYAFDAIANTTEWDPPVFVYAHIYAPHPPFVFGPNGDNVQPNRKYSTHDAVSFYADGGTRDEYIKGYGEQIEYLNKRLIKLINHILSRKNNFSVIILQGDHGPRSMADWGNPNKTYWKECYSILNAYYLPGNGNKTLYESISPVNTFRMIFNLYFGESYDLLEDRSYFYDIYWSPAIVDVTNKIDRGE